MGRDVEVSSQLAAQDRELQAKMDKVIQLRREAKAEEARSNAKIEKYLSQMPDGVDTSKVPSSARGELQGWAKSKHIEFGNYAQQAAVAESQGDYSTAISYKQKMAQVEQQFKNLDSQLSNFKQYKDTFLKDAEDGAISNALNPKKRALLSSVYTDDMIMEFTDEGTIMFTDETGYLKFDDIPDYTVKNNKGASEILKMNDSLFNSGSRISSSKERLLKMKLQNITKSRDEVLSLATDDFITEGGLGILDQDLLYNVERTDELRNKVIDSYMQMFKETANLSYSQKQSRANNGSALSERDAMAQIKGLADAMKTGDPEAINEVLGKGFDVMQSDIEKGKIEIFNSKDEMVVIDPTDINELTKLFKLKNIPERMWPDLSLIDKMKLAKDANDIYENKEIKDPSYYIDKYKHTVQKS
jgi:hypothetical protein